MYFYLILYVIFYCIIHSLLADNKILKSFYYLWWYRFFYVLTSILLLIPLGYFYLKTDNVAFFSYNIYIKTILWFLWFFGLYVGYLASKEYDNQSFLGLRQIKKYFSDGIKEGREYFSLKTEGLLGIVRHPYYFASLILLWARPLYLKDILLNTIFTIYFVLGAKNEERKLILEYGNEYINYKNKVPMLIPKIGQLLKYIQKSFK